MTEIIIESGSQESPGEFDIVYNVAMAHFDAVLSMALALNNSIPALRGLNLSVADYGLEIQKVLKLLQKGFLI